MPRQSIEEITVGSNEKGRFNGGYIYSLKFDLGYSQNVDKLTISVVDCPAPSLGKLIGDIKVGNAVYKDCYILSFEESKTPGQQICNITFVSKSHFLDKFFVGIAKRHCNPFIVGLGGELKLEPGFSFGPGSFSKEVECPSCTGEPRVVNGQINRKVLLGYSVIGRVLCMGGEEPPDNGCDVPEIYYSVGNLLGALNQALGKVGISVRGNIPYTDYKINYAGSLREVLSNICNDTGNDFYFDWNTNSLVIYDLKAGISAFEGGDESTSSSITKSQTLENTYSIRPTSFGFKPGGSLSYTTSFARSLTFTHDMKINVPGWESYFVGGIWGKIDANARKLYYMKTNNWNRIGLIDLGIEIPAKQLIENGFSVKTYIDFKDRFDALGVTPTFRFFIEDTKLETYHQEIESYVIENYGRYFYSSEPNPEDFENCNNGRRLKVSSEYDPDLNVYSKGLYYIDKEPTYCPRLEEITFDGNIEDFFPVYMDYAGQLRLAVLNSLSFAAGQDIDSYASQGRLLFALMPKTQDLPIFGKLGELTSEKNGCEPNISNGLYFNKNTTEEDTTPPECKGPCESSAQSEICNKNIQNCGSQLVRLPGHTDNRCRYISIGYGKTKLNIKLPVISDFYGIEIKKAEVSAPFDSRSISPENDKSVIPNQLAPMKFQINANDFSSYMNTNNFPPIPYESVTNPERGSNIKVIGIKNIVNYPLSPTQGLSSMSLYIDENGSFADLSYRSRAPKLPSQEVVLQSIRPNKVSIRN